MFMLGMAGIRNVTATVASVTGLPSCFTTASTLLAPFAGSSIVLKLIVKPFPASAAVLDGAWPHAVPKNVTAANIASIFADEPITWLMGILLVSSKTKGPSASLAARAVAAVPEALARDTPR